MFSTPPLPFDLNALAPTMSPLTLEIHHDRHHAAYVKKTNALVKELRLDGEPLEEVIRAAREQGATRLFNQAAQAWNHAFFWNVMAPPATQGRGRNGPLRKAIETAFGSRSEFRDKFVAEGEAHFGSGWIWLVADAEGAVRLLTTHDADTPAAKNELRPLAVCDLWEHAYYLDYQNDRAAFLRGFIDRLIDWSFAEEQYDAAVNGAAGWRHPPPEIR
jgi:Fe-Mn family superoxide dismutase